MYKVILGRLFRDSLANTIPKIPDNTYIPVAKYSKAFALVNNPSCFIFLAEI